MGPKSCRSGDDVTNGQEVKLCKTIAASAVYWEENWPDDAAANEANISQDLEIAEEKVGIKRAIVEDVGVWDLEEGYDPVEETRRQFRSGFPIVSCVRYGAGLAIGTIFGILLM